MRRKLPAFAVIPACVLRLLSVGCGHSPGQVETTMTGAIATTAGTSSTVSTGSGPTTSTLSDGATVTETVTNESTSPETTVFTGSTVPGDQVRALAFVGPATRDIFRALREIVIGAGDDGQKVLDEVAKLAAGVPVGVPQTELDSVGGIGFSAGAGTSQPIAVAVDDAGNQVVVFAYTVPGRSDATTIVGFEQGTHRVAIVEGPLPISDSTPNLTTVPSP